MKSFFIYKMLSLLKFLLKTKKIYGGKYTTVIYSVTGPTDGASLMDEVQLEPSMSQCTKVGCRDFDQWFPDNQYQKHINYKYHKEGQKKKK